MKIRNKLFRSHQKGYVDKQGYIRNGDYWILNITKKSDLFRFTNEVKHYLKHKQKVLDANKVIRNINNRNKKYGFIGM